MNAGCSLGKRSVFLMALVLVGCLMFLSNVVAGGMGKGSRSKNIAPIPQTGQTLCYDLTGLEILCEGTGQDADLHAGVLLPTPRFIINGDGTVTDRLTKLVWLQDADRFAKLTWQAALDACNSLAADGVNLADGSIAGDWRLPSVRELFSLIHYGFHEPAVSDTEGTGQWSEGDPFVNKKSELYYWSSTTNVQPPHREMAVWVNLSYGGVGASPKVQTDYFRIWPVRDAN